MSTGRRAIATFVVCLLVLMFWTEVIVPMIYPRKPQPKTPKTDQTQPVKTDIPKEQKVPVFNRPSTDERLPATGISFNFAFCRINFYRNENIILKNDNTLIETDSFGASIKQIAIDYKDERIGLLKSYSARPPHFSMTIKGIMENDATWKIISKSQDIVEFERTLPNGLVVTKKFKITHKYRAELSLSLRNDSDKRADILIQLTPFSGIEHDSLYRYDQFLTGFAAVGDSIRWFPYPTFSNEHPSESVSDSSRYIGLKNRYFAVALVPRSEDAKRIKNPSFRKLNQEETNSSHGVNNIINSVELPLIIEPGKKSECVYDIYFGPQERGELAHLKIDPIFSYAFLDFIGVALIWIINTLSPIAGYGLAIILCTIVVKIVLFPLTRKQYFSMLKMQKLQPKIELLKARYKDDQKKLMQEQMKMFKEYKVNPMGGCLPMFLQLPIWIAIYSVVETSVELRNVPFLWAVSISEPDRLAVFPQPINLLIFHVYELNLLPLLMTVIWVVQSMTQPKSEDPQARAQQRIFMFMPVIFGLMFYGMAAGLSLYFLAQAFVGIVEQKLIKKMFSEEEKQWA